MPGSWEFPLSEDTPGGHTANVMSITLGSGAKSALRPARMMEPGRQMAALFGGRPVLVLSERARPHNLEFECFMAGGSQSSNTRPYRQSGGVCKSPDCRFPQGPA